MIHLGRKHRAVWLGLGLALFAVSCGGHVSPQATPGPAKAMDGLPGMALVLRAEDRRLVDEELLGLLTHEDDAMRAAAVLALGRIGDASVADRVERALADDAAVVRARAAFALGLLTPPDSLDALHEHVVDAAPEVRASVADALGMFADPGSDWAILDLMDDEESVASSACFAVERYEHASFAVDRLVELTKSPEAQVLFACTYALSELAARVGSLDRSAQMTARARLLELSESRHSQLRRLAARGMNVPTSDAEAAATGRLVEDPDPGVRIAAIHSLSFPGAPLEPFLTKAYEDQDDRVFLALIDALGRMRGPGIIEILARVMVHDPRLWVRERAVTAAGRASRMSAQMANGLSRDEDVRIRRATATMLVGLVDEETLEFAQRLFADDDPLVRSAVVPAFADADGPLSELLASAIDDPDPAVRAATARAAGRRLADPDAGTDAIDDALDVLSRLWNDAQDPQDRLVAVEVMRAAGRSSARSRVRALLERGVSSADYQVRLESIAALQRVYGEDRSEAAGAAATRPLEEYVAIAEWAEKEHAAIVTVRRPGFVPGRFTLRLDTRLAPLTAWNFAELATSGFYDGQEIYRLVPDAFVRTGAPRADGGGGPGYTVRDELQASRFWPGTLGMSSSGRDRAGSSWFITLSARPRLMTRATAFGRVVKNFQGVVARMLPHDRIVSIEIYEGDGNEPLPPLE